MVNKPKTYLQAINYLQQNRVMHKIAQRYNIDVDKGGFLGLYKSTLKAIVDKIIENNISPNDNFQEGEAEEFIQSFVLILLNRFGYSQHLKAKNQMFATGEDGRVVGMAGTLNEEIGDWTDEDKEILFKTLMKPEYVNPLVKAYRKEYPDSDEETLKKVLRMSMDIAMHHLEEEYTPPLNHFELKEFMETVTELVINIGSSPSIFFSVSGEKTSASNLPKDAGIDPFERGSFASVGLNENLDKWTQTKLEQHIKKEAEKLLKKGDYVNKKEVKEMIRKTIVQQYKYLWEKSAFFINQI